MELIKLLADRAVILREGVWMEWHVKARENKRFVPAIPKEMEILAKKNFIERKAKNPRLFDGNVFHLDVENSILTDDFILLSTGKIKYSLYDICRKEYAEQYGWTSMPTGMGTIVIVATSDGKIVMHRRFAHVDHTAKLSAIGGIYEGGNPFADIRKEIKEELAIDAELKKLILIGVYSRLDERVNHGLAFYAETLLTSDEILKREKTLKNREGKIFFISKDRHAIQKYLKANHLKMITDGIVGLILTERYLRKHR